MRDRDSKRDGVWSCPCIAIAEYALRAEKFLQPDDIVLIAMSALFCTHLIPQAVISKPLPKSKSGGEVYKFGRFSLGGTPQNVALKESPTPTDRTTR